MMQQMQQSTAKHHAAIALPVRALLRSMSARPRPFELAQLDA
jgi:hypothetical protein